MDRQKDFAMRELNKIKRVLSSGYLSDFPIKEDCKKLDGVFKIPTMSLQVLQQTLASQNVCLCNQKETARLGFMGGVWG